MATIHDYRRRSCGWGHDCSFRPAPGGDGTVGSGIGWGRGIKKGDVLLLGSGPNGASYVVETISYYRDPPDMWRASLRYDASAWGEPTRLRPVFSL